MGRFLLAGSWPRGAPGFGQLAERPESEHENQNLKCLGDSGMPCEHHINNLVNQISDALHMSGALNMSARKLTYFIFCGLPGCVSGCTLTSNKFWLHGFCYWQSLGMLQAGRTIEYLLVQRGSFELFPTETIPV